MSDLEPFGFREASDEAIARARAFAVDHPAFAEDRLIETDGTITSDSLEGVTVIPGVPLPHMTVEVNSTKTMRAEGAFRHVRQWVTALAIRQAAHKSRGSLSEAVAGSITPFVPLAIIGRSASQRFGNSRAWEENEEWPHPSKRLGAE